MAAEHGSTGVRTGPRPEAVPDWPASRPTQECNRAISQVQLTGHARSNFNALEMHGLACYFLRIVGHDKSVIISESGVNCF